MDKKILLLILLTNKLILILKNEQNIKKYDINKIKKYKNINIKNKIGRCNI